MVGIKYHFELAAMGGHAFARLNLGILEDQSNNTNRAIKHYMIAAGAGHDTVL